MRGVPGAAPSLASGAVSPVSVPSPRACMKRDGQMGWSGEEAPSKPGSRPLCDVPPPICIGMKRAVLRAPRTALKWDTSRQCGGPCGPPLHAAVLGP